MPDNYLNELFISEAKSVLRKGKNGNTNVDLSGYQEKLTAGENITIDENNVISATGGSSGENKLYRHVLQITFIVEVGSYPGNDKRDSMYFLIYSKNPHAYTAEDVINYLNSIEVRSYSSVPIHSGSDCYIVKSNYGSIQYQFTTAKNMITNIETLVIDRVVGGIDSVRDTVCEVTEGLMLV